jgi:hypothetical protein
MVPLGVGEGSVDGAVTVPTVRLVLRLAAVGAVPLSVGDGIPDVRLEIRGILVGVSFGRPEAELFRDDGGSSFGSLCACGVVPTDGEPAIVGSWLRLLRSDVSDCLCMELIVCDVTREPAAALAVDPVLEDAEFFRFATR